MDELSRRNLVTVAAITMASTVALAGASLMSTARAADFPTRAITLVVPYPAGGGVMRWRAWWRKSCRTLSVRP